jgi:DNA (cytosine-5)-methyltransferase 1
MIKSPLPKKIKVLNLYAGIGGNRKLWTNVDVTAVERNKNIAKVYQDFFPDDEVITTNAHKFLLDNYSKYDFVWSSPPCPTHSTMRNLKNNCEETVKKYPNMMLYEEILYLSHFFKGIWVVENVISYYNPLVKPYESENHYFWSNFNITNRKKIIRGIRDTRKTKHFGFDLRNYNLPNKLKIQMLNNLVNPKLGLHIFNCAFKEKQQKVGDYEKTLVSQNNTQADSNESVS